MLKIVISLLVVSFLDFQLLCQIQLQVDGSGELASFQTDLSSGRGGTIRLLKGFDAIGNLGYLGVHRFRPNDLEFGAGVNGKVTFSMLNVPQLTIGRTGQVIVKNLYGRNFSQLYATPEGKITELLGERVYTAHFAHFRPSEDDGEFVEIVQPIDEVEFVKHQSDVGELSAPLKLPKGAKITKLKVYYINEAPDNSSSNAFEVCIETAISDVNFILQNRTPWLDLPVDGSFFSGTFSDGVIIASREQTLTPIEVDHSVGYYNVIVRCKDCSEQYIRAVDIIYKF